MNSFMLVGKVKAIGDVMETSMGAKVSNLIVDVQRNFRNADSTLESDEFQVTLWQGMAESVAKHAKLGETIAIRGRLAANNYTSKDGKLMYASTIIAEKLSYLD